jgi:hypothetical protein
MIKKLLNGLLVLTALLIPSFSFANSMSEVPGENLPISVVSIPVVQSLPVDDKTPGLWLTGRVSLIGGEVSSSKQQYLYAEQKRVPIITRNNFDELVESGDLVRLEGPNIQLGSDKVTPYVLPSSKNFVLQLAYEFGQQGCGRLVVLDALRIVGDKMPEAASFFSVHLRGMAVDIRVRDIGERCETWMNTYLLENEAAGKVDATREHWKVVRGEKVPNPHFHLVVPLEPRGPNLLQSVAVASVGAL